MDSGEGTEERPVRTKKGEFYTPRKRKASDPNQKSLAEFFAENKKIAGFDNPGKSLYSTVRELVENALDSAEIIGELPSVKVTIEELNWSKVNSMSGGIDEKQLGKKVKEGTAGKASIYRVTCKDNGRGLCNKDLHNLFGRALSRKKCGAKQTRGKSGLGAKMAFIWSKLSTGEPVEISTSTKNQNWLKLSLDIDIDMPNIHSQEAISKTSSHGSEIKVVIEGDWKGYRGEILEYMRQMAVITPHAEFVFRFVPDTRTRGRYESIMYERSATVMPAVTLNPLAEDLNLLVRRLTGESSNLLEFLQHEFVDIGEEVATNLIRGFMGPDVTSKTQVNSLTSPQLLSMQQLFKVAAMCGDPRGGGRLIPVGEKNLGLGIRARLAPDMVATCTERGYIDCTSDFIVEVGVCLGGDLEEVQQGLRIFRFANRVPLLFDEDDDVVTKTVKRRIDWKAYKIDPKRHRLSVFVSIVSTKIPFKRMECIGDETGKIALAVKMCIEECCKQLLPEIIAAIEEGERALESLLQPHNKKVSSGVITENYPRHNLLHHHVHV